MPNIRQWAESRLPSGVALGDVRVGDILEVTEDDVLAHVNEHGFDARSVREDDFVWIPDDLYWIVEDAGRFHFFYHERGNLRTEGWFDNRTEARRAVIRVLMTSARRWLTASVGSPNSAPGARP